MNETARDYAETKRGLKNQIQEREPLRVKKAPLTDGGLDSTSGDLQSREA